MPFQSKSISDVEVGDEAWVFSSCMNSWHLGVVNDLWNDVEDKVEVQFFQGDLLCRKRLPICSNCLILPSTLTELEEHDPCAAVFPNGPCAEVVPMRLRRKWPAPAESVRDSQNKRPRVSRDTELATVLDYLKDGRFPPEGPCSQEELRMTVQKFGIDHDIFISRKKENSEDFARELKEALQQRKCKFTNLPYKVCFDRDEFVAPSNANMMAHVMGSKCLLTVVDGLISSSPYVQTENLVAQLLGIPIIPVYRADLYTWSDIKAIEHGIHRQPWMDLLRVQFIAFLPKHKKEGLDLIETSYNNLVKGSHEGAAERIRKKWADGTVTIGGRGKRIKRDGNVITMLDA